MAEINTNSMEQVMQINEDTINILNSVLVGQDKVKKVIAASILCDSNSKILLTGKTGMGKTTLSNFLAHNFASLRISVTSDLLPSEVQEQLKKNQNLRLLYIDEFNRASGKVLATFDELFAERQITLDGKTYDFNDFYVLATQNNVDISGIFNVPFMVLDRFDVNVAFDALTESEKRELLFGKELHSDRKIDVSDILFTQDMVNSLKLKEKSINLLMKMFNLIDALTHNEKSIFYGSNIRAHKFAIKLAKFNALADGRDYILPRDLSDFINYLYLHRLNQNVLKMDSEDAQNIFADAKSRILKIRN